MRDNDDDEARFPILVFASKRFNRLDISVHALSVVEALRVDIFAIDGGINNYDLEYRQDMIANQGAHHRGRGLRSSPLLSVKLSRLWIATSGASIQRHLGSRVIRSNNNRHMLLELK